MTKISRYTDIRWTDRYVTDYGVIQYGPNNWANINYIANVMHTNRPDAAERWAQACIESGLPIDD